MFPRESELKDSAVMNYKANNCLGVNVCVRARACFPSSPCSISLPLPITFFLSTAPVDSSDD